MAPTGRRSQPPDPCWRRKAPEPEAAHPAQRAWASRAWQDSASRETMTAVVILFPSIPVPGRSAEALVALSLGSGQRRPRRQWVKWSGGTEDTGQNEVFPSLGLHTGAFFLSPGTRKLGPYPTKQPCPWARFWLSPPSALFQSTSGCCGSRAEEPRTHSLSRISFSIPY